MIRTTLTVCIATYKRSEGLHRLLESLRIQEFIQNKKPDWNIVVVDNDELATNENFIKELSKDFPVPIMYGVQPKRGIASARNLAVELAGNSDYVAFIDDDEVAGPNWLDELLTGIETYRADVVTGPVIPAFEEPPKEWMIRGGFFTRARFTTGEEIKVAATNNTLVSKKWLHLWKGPFDERLSFVGGSDTLLFTKIHQSGGKIVWLDEVVVHEYNPPQRTNLKWILKRSLRLGNSVVQIERMANESITIKIIRIIKCGGHLVGGILLFIPYGLIFGFPGIVKSLCIFSRGIGEMMGISGLQYEIYK